MRFFPERLWINRVVAGSRSRPGVGENGFLRSPRQLFFRLTLPELQSIFHDDELWQLRRRSASARGASLFPGFARFRKGSNVRRAHVVATRPATFRSKSR